MLFSLIVFLFLYLLQLASAQIGETCQKIQDKTKPEAAEVKAYFKSQVCGKGKCKPTLKETDKKLFITSLWPNLLKKLASDEGLNAGQTKKVDAFKNDVTNDILKDCKKSLGKSNLCQTNKDVDAFNKCIQDNLFPIVFSRLFDIQSLATEPYCQKHLKFLKDPKTMNVLKKGLDVVSQKCTK